MTKNKFNRSVRSAKYFLTVLKNNFGDGVLGIECLENALCEYEEKRKNKPRNKLKETITDAYLYSIMVFLCFVVVAFLVAPFLLLVDFGTCWWFLLWLVVPLLISIIIRYDNYLSERDKLRSMFDE